MYEAKKHRIRVELETVPDELIVMESECPVRHSAKSLRCSCS